MTKKLTRNELHAEKIGQAVAQGMFTDMLDVTNQGYSFTWEKFPEIFSGIVETQVFMGFKDTVKNLDDLKAIAVTTYVEEGNRLKSEYQGKDILPIKPHSPKI